MAVTLVQLAPDPETDPVTAHRYGTHLADLLNADDALPPNIRLPPGAPRQTAEDVLAYTREWCRTRNAKFFAVVVDDIAIGSISLSHIDAAVGCARTGYWLANCHHGHGYGTEALSQLLDMARRLGLSRVSGLIDEANVASRQLWQSCGAKLQMSGREFTAVL